MPRVPTKNFTFRVPIALLDDYAKLAERDGRTISNKLCRDMRASVEKETRRKRPAKRPAE